MNKTFTQQTNKHNKQDSSQASMPLRQN